SNFVRPRAPNALDRGKSCLRSAATPSTPTSPRGTPRRCGNGRRRVPRPSDMALPRLGPAFGLGVTVALVTAGAGQALKLWLLYGFDLPGRGRVELGPFVDLVLAWNTGISYGLLQDLGPLGQWVLFALKVVAVVLLGIWLARTTSRLSAIALGLIIGGAIG